jgi:polar amino acid transport system substrate-binding protein
MPSYMRPDVIIVRQHHRWVIAYVVGIGLLLCSLRPFSALGQDDPALAGRLVVGVMNSPPFAMKTTDGGWEGLSIELWRKVARDLAVEFELQEYSSILQIQVAFENGKLDVIAVAAVSADREVFMAFSNPFYRSGSAIAVSSVSNSFNWLRLAERFLSPNFLKVMGFLTLLLIFVGAVVWMFERRRNGDMFGDRLVKGIGHGIWWAAVTMTTVAYGDKAPATLGGRIAAIAWLMISIALVSVLTATVTTSPTVMY